jgi:hypothetical protein
MKTKKRPLITKAEMKHVLSVARHRNEKGIKIEVLPMLRQVLPGKKITGQVRRLVTAELDKAGIPRIRREDVTRFNKARKLRRELDAAFVATDHKDNESVPGVLGGLAGDVIDPSFEFDADVERRDLIDDLLSAEADRGNERALNLLLRRIRRI